jgi:hypothetical protein
MTRARTLPLAAVIAAALVACGGAQTYAAQGTTIAPGASAAISVGKTEGAQSVDVTIDHLTPPERLGPGHTQFAVWVVPAGLDPVLAGTLAYDRESQSGRLLATTPYEIFQVVVTAEGPSIGRAPGGPVVLQRSVGVP